MFEVVSDSKLIKLRGNLNPQQLVDKHMNKERTSLFFLESTDLFL